MSFCDTDLPVRCEACFEQTVTTCDIVTIAAGLTASTTFELFILDQFANQYNKPVTTDGSGSFEIDFSVFPDGLFNPNGGEYEVFISAAASPVTVIPMTLSGVIFNCILLTFTTCCPPESGELVDNGGNFVADQFGDLMPEPKI